MTKIRILVVDDHAVLRAGLRALFTLQRDMEVVGEASEGDDAIGLAEQLQPDVVLMDISLPGVGGVEATRRIAHAKSHPRVLMLTMFDNPHYLFEALQAGAAGYVPKRAADAELLSAIRAVARGESFLYPSAAKALITQFLEQGRERQDSYDLLTAREKEVLRLIAEGYTNKQIADMLYVSPNTVEVHRSRIREKLNVHDRTEILKYALSRGLIESLPSLPGAKSALEGSDS
ncbi:MAG: response regulator transcription factor [Chloroflexi bacterium]|nr:response regulator transcription factor [Chloroflexota bacterium]